MSAITIQCQFCASPLTLDIPPDVIGWGLDVCRRLALMTVHDHCAEMMAADQRRTSEDVRLAKAMQAWELLCPPLYQNSDEWLASPDAAKNKVLNMRKIRQALEWSYGPKGLVMFGERSGTGKTSTAYVLIRREVIAGRACAAFTHTEFSRKATQFVVNDREKAGTRWIRLLGTVDLLVIDDFGKSRFKTAGGESKAAEELLFDVIDARVVKKLPTILTSNDTAASIKARMSEDKAVPFLRRLQEFFDAVNFDA